MDRGCNRSTHHHVGGLPDIPLLLNPDIIGSNHHVDSLPDIPILFNLSIIGSNRECNNLRCQWYVNSFIATSLIATASESNSISLSGEDIIAIVTSIAGTILAGLAVWIAWMTYKYMKATSSEKQGGYAHFIARGRSPRRGRSGSSHEPKISVPRA